MNTQPLAMLNDTLGRATSYADNRESVGSSEILFKGLCPKCLPQLKVVTFLNPNQIAVVGYTAIRSLQQVTGKEQRQL